MAKGTLQVLPHIRHLWILTRIMVKRRGGRRSNLVGSWDKKKSAVCSVIFIYSLFVYKINYCYNWIIMVDGSNIDIL
jgi:hypothetical protein